MALKANESLLNGKYLIERVLGRGGFGFVYLARDTLIGRPVAIKEMNPTLADDEQMVRRFLVEGRAALQVRHPNVVELFDVFSDRGVYYLAMEYCPGGSLEERLAAGPLALRDALTVMDQVCAGLMHTHGRGIVHCDIKPANILFGADGQAKVTDFGIAHVSPTAVTRSWGTSSGFAGGTLAYMAPEQLDGVRDDPRLDVYALGAMLFKMLTGANYLDFRPEQSISDQIHNALLIKQGTPVAPSQRARGIPAWLDGVVLQALSKQPAARFADSGALRAALQAASPPPRGFLRRPRPGRLSSRPKP
ncbi:serine/threonine-protein kinase [Candidatus Amarolinea dominans]|uniref:serine/threonine-protein kinase n=1 Tax=Candidatus Amarolinea dominans TaxID=3140696 RepID=UPI0031354637|nr:serine/threonine protein kinase [Anaerolineae bacterium]